MSEPQGTVEGRRRVRADLEILKRDQLGRVERLRAGGGWVVRRVACGSRVPFTGWIARALARRERAALERLAGVEGVARLVADPRALAAPDADGAPPRASRSLLRSWIDGVGLHEADALPEDFFDRLEELVSALHARGVCHNDLHKEQNVIVGADGYPWLVDFQLASVHRRSTATFRSRARDDLRHVEKLRRRYRLRGRVPEVGEPPMPRRSVVAALWLRSGKPFYRFVTRRLLHARDGESRRASAGPWPSWTAATGPRPSASRLQEVP